jgi:Domain of unknown function (DUF4398)
MSHARPTFQQFNLPRMSLLTVGALVLAGCASAPVPTEQIAVSRAAISQATSAGAGEFAPAELGLARDKMARADAAVAAGEGERALPLAQQAQADAQVAGAKAAAIKARRAADTVLEASRALREEMSRQTPAAMTPLVMPATTTPRN